MFLLDACFISLKFFLDFTIFFVQSIYKNFILSIQFIAQMLDALLASLLAAFEIAKQKIQAFQATKLYTLLTEKNLLDYKITTVLCIITNFFIFSGTAVAVAAFAYQLTSFLSNAIYLFLQTEVLGFYAELFAEWRFILYSHFTPVLGVITIVALSLRNFLGHIIKNQKRDPSKPNTMPTYIELGMNLSPAYHLLLTTSFWIKRVAQVTAALFMIGILHIFQIETPMPSEPIQNNQNEERPHSFLSDEKKIEQDITNLFFFTPFLTWMLIDCYVCMPICNFFLSIFSIEPITYYDDWEAIPLPDLEILVPCIIIGLAFSLLSACCISLSLYYLPQLVGLLALSILAFIDIALTAAASLIAAAMLYIAHTACTLALGLSAYHACNLLKNARNMLDAHLITELFELPSNPFNTKPNYVMNYDMTPQGLDDHKEVLLLNRPNWDLGGLDDMQAPLKSNVMMLKPTRV